MAGWDVALLPFAINEATRFISPTKTPEYLAAGCPVVSTPVRDVVRSYGDMPGVRIAERRGGVRRGLRRGDRRGQDRAGLARRGRPAAGGPSWDATHARMAALVDGGGRRARHGRSRPHFPGRRCAGGRRRPTTSSWPGRASPDRCSPSGWRRARASGCSSATGGRMSPATPMTARDAAGILVHRYGPHIFHTNSDEIVAYLSRFTEWRPYEHRVLADLGDRRLPMPINRTTLAALFGRPLPDDAAAERLLAELAEPVPTIRNRPRRRGLGRRAAALRDLLRGLHPQAVGPRPLRARQVGDGARAGAELARRSLLPRQLPGDAARRLHADVRADARPRAASTSRSAPTSTTWRPRSLAPLTIYTGPIDGYFGHRFGASALSQPGVPPRDP